MPINEEQALQSLDGSKDLLRDLAAIFAEDSPQLVDDFRAAVAERDANRAKLSAHSLKGLTSTFYARSEVDQIAAIEQAATEEDWKSLESAPKTLDEIIRSLIDSMRSASWLNAK
jgi:HPt (histidine-containing phosphotransfer) domain-containing protein